MIIIFVFQINPHRNAKQQALEVIPLLKSVIRIERAQMRLNIIIPGKEAKRIREKMVPLIAQVEREDWTDGTLNLLCLMDPGKYREIEDLVHKESKGAGNVELLSMREITEGEEVLE